MAAPGSSHALVLPGASVVNAEPEAGARLHDALAQFLDTDEYRALAVVHGLTKTASTAFDLAKARSSNVDGVIWLTDADLLPLLDGENAKLLRKLLKPFEGYVVTFASVGKQAVTGKLDRWEIGPAEFDAKFAAAERD